MPFLASAMVTARIVLALVFVGVWQFLRPELTCLSWLFSIVILSGVCGAAAVIAAEKAAKPGVIWGLFSPSAGAFFNLVAFFCFAVVDEQSDFAARSVLAVPLVILTATVVFSAVQVFARARGEKARLAKLPACAGIAQWSVLVLVSALEDTGFAQSISCAAAGITVLLLIIYIVANTEHLKAAWRSRPTNTHSDTAQEQDGMEQRTG